MDGVCHTGGLSVYDRDERLADCPGGLPAFSAGEKYGDAAASGMAYTGKTAYGAVRTDACFARVFLRYLPPAVCYFTAVLFIPLLRRIYRNDWAGFWDYAGLVTVVCLAVLFCFGLTGMLCKRAGAKRGLERI